MDKDNFKLDFVAIGAQRSATTWIYECLRAHPEISMCEPKEINFFGTEKYDFDMDWYKRHFHPNVNTNFFGEFTSTYIYSKEAAHRIKDNFPNAKIILCLRNPIDRFISHVSAQGKVGDLDKAAENSRDLIDRGFYARHLKKYTDLFGMDRVFVVIYEDIGRNPQEVVSAVYDFIGADSFFVPPILRDRVNPSREYKIVAVKRFIDSIIDFIEGKRLGVSIINFLKRIGARRIFYAVDEINSSAVAEKGETQGLRRKLYEIYEEDISKLERLIKRDLSFWR